MKKELVVFFMMLFPLAVSADVEINETNFPDENFRNFLLEQEYGKDGVITDAEIAGNTVIFVDQKKIKSLKGIEFFTALTQLNCSDNQLTSLDVSGLMALETLSCSENQLTSLNVSGCTKLQTLECSDNQLIALDVSGATALTRLYCNENQIASLDVSMNTLLIDLSCNKNQLHSLDVSKNTTLGSLDCSENHLTSLDVSNNTVLDWLNCNHNEVTSLSFTNNTKINYLYCRNNKLTSLDVSACTTLEDLHCDGNQLTSLEISKEARLTRFQCYKNQIKGSEMDKLIQNLPKIADNYGTLYVIWNEDEGNEMNNEQIVAVGAKGWTPYYFNGKDWKPYNSSAPITAKIDDIYYELTNKTSEATIIKLSDQYKGDITIPSIVTYEGVDFNVTSIEDAAFNGCEELKSVYIPGSITKIGYGLFIGCNALTKIVVSNDNMVYDSRNNCNAIIETANNMLINGCNNSTIPYSVQTIASSAFKNCLNLTKVSLPNSIVYLAGFTGCENLSEINIPNSVLHIMGDTFRGCKSLKSINLPTSLQSLSNGCFAQSGLQSISIPNSVTHIEGWAFSECFNLEDIGIPNSVSYIGERAFENCDALKTIKLPKGLETLNSNVFYHCGNLQTVYLPSTLKSIGDSFNACWKISDVYCFAEDVPITDSNAFYFSSIDKTTTLHVPAQSIDKYKSASVWSNFENIVALTEEDLKIYDEESQITVDNNGIEGLYKTQPDSYRISKGEKQTYGTTPPCEIIIKDNGDGSYYVDDLFGGWYWHRVGYGSNYAMTGNIIITKEGTVTLKDSHVSGWDDSLISLTGSYDASTSTFNIEAEYVNGIKFYQTWVKDKQVVNIDGINYKIGNDNKASVVKGGYSGVITIPDKISYNDKSYPVTSIGRAFVGCHGLTSVTIPNSITSLNFYGCSNLTSVTIPNSVISIGQNAFGDCQSLSSITIPNSVVSIDYMAFNGCNNLSNLTLSDNLTTIGECSFMDCHNLKSLVIPASVLTIGNVAFGYCESLESIKIDSKNTKYDSRDNCNAIIETATNTLICGTKNTIIPNSVTSIVNDAFSGCLGLTSITIPNSVTSIGNGAFFQCDNLSSMSVESSNTKYDSRDNCNAIIETATNTLICGIKNTVIPNSVTSIGKGAFNACVGLTSITIPHNVTSIGDYSFGECTNLISVTVENKTPVAITENTFTNRSEATLYVPVGCKAAYEAADYWKEFSSIEEFTAITVTAKSYSRAYGEANPTFDYAVAGGDISGTPAITCAATATSNVGTYDIVISKGTVTNTDVVFVNGTLTINKAPLKITAGSYTKKQGEENPTFTLTYDGFKNNETATVFTTQPTITCAATKDSPAGTYDITVSGAVAGNYEISYVAGTLTIEAVPTPEPTPEPKGTAFEEDIDDSASKETIATFTVTEDSSSDTPTVTISADEDGVTGQLEIPETVKHNGVEYKVTEISDGAFQNNSALTDVTIPASIVSIGDNAFAGCSNLKSITIYVVEPINLSSIAARAYVRALTRLSGDDVFEGVDKNTCILYVPEGSVEKYKAAPVWKDFKNIQAIGTTGIKGIEMTDGETFDVYNLSGRKVKSNATSLDGLPRGIYIVKGKKVMK